MGLESFTYISSLNASNPVTGDNKTEGDDHIRGTKTTLLNSFPAVSGAVTATHTELNYVDGVTSAIQTQLDAKAALASATFTGTVKVTNGLLYSYGYSGNANQGVFYMNSAGTQYLFNNNNTLVYTGTIEGNGGGGNGLGKITVSTSAPSGGAAGDIWIQY